MSFAFMRLSHSARSDKSLESAFWHFWHSLTAAHGKRTVQVAIVPNAAEPKAGPGRGLKAPEPEPTAESAEDKTEATELQLFNHETTRRLRAINRAPDSVKDAYREGRISQTLAAKLGQLSIFIHG